MPYRYAREIDKVLKYGGNVDDAINKFYSDKPLFVKNYIKNEASKRKVSSRTTYNLWN